MTVTYARVSSNDQKDDLERQKIVLEAYCAQKGWSFEVISDLGSGLNYRKKGLIKLIKLICSEQVERLVLTHKDRLLRLLYNYFVSTKITNNSFNADLIG